MIEINKITNAKIIPCAVSEASKISYFSEGDNPALGKLGIDSELSKLEENAPAVAKKLEQLCNNINSYDKAIVAFSGGADSALVAFLTKKLTEKSLCVIGDSPTIPPKG